MQPQAESEFDRLNRAFRPALMAFFLRRMRNHAEAGDMTQELFVRLVTVDRRELQSPSS